MVLLWRPPRRSGGQRQRPTPRGPTSGSDDRRRKIRISRGNPGRRFQGIPPGSILQHASRCPGPRFPEGSGEPPGAGPPHALIQPPGRHAFSSSDLHHSSRIPALILSLPITTGVAHHTSLADPIIARIVHMPMNPEVGLRFLDQCAQIRIESR